VALVTSLRDGMNLVSYEYVACQNSKKNQGVLVLSEVSYCTFETCIFSTLSRENFVSTLTKQGMLKL
jgi:hypothetical protein